MQKDNIIIIVGGGPVGSILALALQQQDIPFTMLEARAKSASILAFSPVHTRENPASPFGNNAIGPVGVKRS